MKPRSKKPNYPLASLNKQTKNKTKKKTQQPHTCTLRHIIIILLKTSDKEKILKQPEGKKDVVYRGAKIRIAANFLWENVQARKQLNDIFKVLKEEKKHVNRDFYIQGKYPSKIKAK